MIVFWLYLLLVPCTPLNIGFLYLSKCEENPPSHFIQIFMHALLSLPLPCLLTFTLICAAMQVIVFTASSCISFLNMCFLFKEKVCHGQASNAKVVIYWREVQVIVCLFNFIHQDFLSISMLMLDGSVFIICSYSVLGLWEYLHYTQLLQYSVLAITVSLLILDVGETLRGNVWSISKYCLATSMRRIKSKTDQRLLRSIRCLKLYIGYSNYHDQTMSIGFLEFILEQTIGLLLV